MTTAEYAAMELESIVDRVGVAVTLEALVEVCQAKAEHLRANWQDEASARVWDRFAKRVGKLANGDCP